MSVDGTWTVVVKSPIGDQSSTITFKTEAGVLTGEARVADVVDPIAGGKVDGDKVSWSNTVTTPFPMTLDFTGTVAGDALSGSVKAGSFGVYPFTGVRA